MLSPGVALAVLTVLVVLPCPGTGSTASGSDTVVLPEQGGCDTVSAAVLDQRAFAALAGSGRPVVITGVDALAEVWPAATTWRDWGHPGVLEQRFGSERAVASVVRGPGPGEAKRGVFESVDATVKWPGAAQFWRRWLDAGVGSDGRPPIAVPDEVWSLRGRRDLRQGPHRPCSPDNANATADDGDICVRFTTRRMVTRPAKVATKISHITSGRLQRSFGDLKARVYLQYQAMPATMLAALGGAAPPPFWHGLGPSFVGLWIGGADGGETVAQLHCKDISTSQLIQDPHLQLALGDPPGIASLASANVLCPPSPVDPGAHRLAHLLALAPSQTTRARTYRSSSPAAGSGRCSRHPPGGSSRKVSVSPKAPCTPPPTHTHTPGSHPVLTLALALALAVTAPREQPHTRHGALNLPMPSWRVTRYCT